jgi:hypothetical protein
LICSLNRGVKGIQKWGLGKFLFGGAGGLKSLPQSNGVKKQGGSYHF